MPELYSLPSKLDATKVSDYQSLRSPYDIVFGHCLYPTCGDGRLGLTPDRLLLNIFGALKADFLARQPSKPVLIIITIPNNRHEAQYNLPELIDLAKGDFQYLGANRYLEENMLKFGYRHERRMEPHYKNIHLIHDELKDSLWAHVFLLKRREK